jgi:hypothetical protein
MRDGKTEDTARPACRCGHYSHDVDAVLDISTLPKDGDEYIVPDPRGKTRADVWYVRWGGAPESLRGTE